MTYEVTTTSRFDRRSKVFFRNHPNLKPRFDEVFLALQQDPFQPALHLHQLTGKLAGRYAIRLTYAHRIVLRLVIVERRIVLTDIGTHDEVYDQAQ